MNILSSVLFIRKFEPMDDNTSLCYYVRNDFGCQFLFIFNCEASNDAKQFDQPNSVLPPHHLLITSPLRHSFHKQHQNLPNSQSFHSARLHFINLTEIGAVFVTSVSQKITPDAKTNKTLKNRKQNHRCGMCTTRDVTEEWQRSNNKSRLLCWITL